MKKHLSLFLFIFHSIASAASMKITPIDQHLWLLQGEGGNIVLAAGSNEALLVDSGLYEESANLRATLTELGVANCRWIINTHFHYDHTGGNALPGATVIATPALRQRLSVPQMLWRQQFPAQPESTWPQMSVDERLTLYLGKNEPVEIIAIPGGHTDSDALVFFPHAGVIAVGDIYFAGMYPIVHPEHGGDLLHMIERLKQALALLPANGKVVPGHGPLATRAELADWIAMVEFSLEHVRWARTAGLTLAQLQQSPLPKPLMPYQHGYRTPAQWWETVWKALPQ